MSCPHAVKWFLNPLDDLWWCAKDDHECTEADRRECALVSPEADE